MSRAGAAGGGLLEGASQWLHWAAGRLHALVGWTIASGARQVLRLVAPVPWSLRMAAFAAAFTALLLLFWAQGVQGLLEIAGLSPEHLGLLEKAGALGVWRFFVGVALALGIFMAAAVPMAFLRNPVSLVVLRVFSGLVAAYTAGALYVFLRLPAALYSLNDKSFDKALRNELLVQGFLAWLPAAALAALFLLATWMNSSRSYYFRAPPAKDLPGDRLVENLRTHGGDPNFRTSLYWAAFLHILVIVILPLILMGGWRVMTPYGVPKGSGVQNPGDPVVKMIRIKRPKKQPRKLYVLNPNSAILFYRPDIAESRILDNVEEMTENLYEATGAKGKLGAGGGTEGGWPHGMEGAKVRFIRLKYTGGDWEQCMGVGADYNLLVKFRALTGFKIADQTEAVEIGDLRRFPRKKAPPFVFLTGSGGISASARDTKALRWYCIEEGGMIFADNGGGAFDRNFRALLQRAFPELQLVDISNDDIIYRQPYSFPNGAPPLWHHSGNRALGLKHNGRWIVFYHQGDIKDAWKDGHSGASKFLAEQAYKLGVNVVNYSFNQYMARHYKQ